MTSHLGWARCFILASLGLLGMLDCATSALHTTSSDGSCSARPEPAATHGAILLQMSSAPDPQALILTDAEVDTATGLQCARGSNCVVEAGQTRVLDRSLDVHTMVVRGTLRWDTSKEGLELRTNNLMVTGAQARLEIGTAERPMSRKATIYIKRNALQDSGGCGMRFVCGKSGAYIGMHGRKLAKTWTLLAANAAAGQSTISLKDDPAEMGWQEGDQIAIATTNRDESFLGRIKALGRSFVTLEWSLQHSHMGGFTEYRGRRFEMAAEVINLERSIVITGDHDSFHDAPFQDALHVMQMRSGVMQVSYTRVEWCGQRDILARYCLHFHMMGWCRDCYFRGNAVFEGNQVGITIHGTHGTTIEENTLWNPRSAGIYTEDGNEMHNRIANNAIICAHPAECRTPWQGFRGSGEANGGLYLIGMTNDVIGNHVAAHENGAWFNGAARPHGHGAAKAQGFKAVCTVYQPFGRVQGNVFHDNWRFGMYPDNQHPRKLKVDPQTGYLTDPSSCDAFLPDGSDNGDDANLIEDQFDWHNMFVGQYDVGDVRWIRFTGIDNGASMYWKTSKNFADGSLHHIVDSLFVSLPHTVLPSLGKTCLSPLIAGGPFTFGLKNVTFSGKPCDGVLNLGQHCGRVGAGSPCNTQYLLDQVTFDLEPGSKRVKWGSHIAEWDPAAEVAPILIAREGDNSLGGFRSILSPHLDGFGREAGCTKLGADWAYGFGCNFAVRRLNVWPLGSARDSFSKGSPMRDLELSGPGYGSSAKWDHPTKGQNSGRMLYSALHKGFGLPVVAGRSYTLRISSQVGDPVIEFSDLNLNRALGTDDSLTLSVQGGVRPHTCTLRGLAARTWMHVLDYSGLEEPQRLRGGCLSDGEQPSGGSPTPGTTWSPPAPATPKPSRCGETSWPDKDHGLVCGACKVLVDNFSSKYKTCRGYCERVGRPCVGAWEEKGDTCEVLHDMACDEEIGSSDAICECGEDEAPAPPPSSEAPTTAPSPEAPAPRPEPTSEPAPPQADLCDEESWPDKDHGLVCGECKVLVDNFSSKYKTCRGYCLQLSRPCAGAWEEAGDTCQVLHDMACDEEIDSSDAICECGSRLASTTPLMPVPTPKPTQAPMPEPMPKPTVPPQPTSPPASVCDETSWPDKDHGLVCGPCKVLVDNFSSKYKTCRGYCEQLGRRCESAWEETGDTCEVAHDLSCDEEIDSSDAICECGAKETAPPGPAPEPPAPNSPSPPAGLAWIHHAGTNCFAGRGGVGVPGKDPVVGEFTPSDCKAKCEMDDRCQGVVVVNTLDRYSCWLRQELKLDECVKSGTYDLWRRAQIPAAQRRVANPSSSSSSAPTWIHYPRTNCYANFGGVEVAGKDPLPGQFTLAECKAQCGNDDHCAGVVIFNNVDRSKCWLRQQLNLDRCLQNGELDVWKRVELPAAQTPSPSMGLAWTHYPRSNCYAGFGGVEVPGKDPLHGRFTVAECKAKCETDDRCVGVVVTNTADRSSCWLRQQLNLDKCLESVDFDVWKRSVLPAQR